MKSNKALIAEDTQALRKLDTLIDEEDPFAKEPGGSAYAPREKGLARITEMYIDNSKKDKAKLVKDIAAGVGLFAIAAVMVALIIILIKL